VLQVNMDIVTGAQVNMDIVTGVQVNMDIVSRLQVNEDIVTRLQVNIFFHQALCAIRQIVSSLLFKIPLLILEVIIIPNF